MTELILAAAILTAPQDNSAIQTLSEYKIVEVAPTPPPPPITWKDNPNNCNEELEWIAAEEPFYCIPKQQTATTARVAQNPVRGAVNASDGWYPSFQCTWWVSTKRPVGQWNNASSWLRQAQRDGWATGSEPAVGAIAWEPNHVSYVESVNGDGTVTVSEYNYAKPLSYGTRTAPATQFKYIY